MKISRRDAVKLMAGSIPAYYMSHRLAFAGEAPAAPAAPAPAASIGLKDAYKGKFLIGTAGDIPGRYSEAELANIKANYNIITPENCMKPASIHPQEDRYNWATADALVDWCQQNDIKVWGHTLCWHAQTGQWFFGPGPDGQQATRELGMERLQKHIATEVGRYKGRVMGWDVVNESIADNNNDGTTEHLRTNSWYSFIGPDVLNLAFKWAHEADPDAQLYYNDYNIDQGAVGNKGKHASSMLLLKRLIDQGAPINGVGIQGHWHLDTNMEDVDKAIEDYKSLGLKVSISELDVTATGTNSGSFNIGGAGGGAGGGNRRGRGRGPATDTPPATNQTNPGPGAMAPAQNGIFSLAGFGGGAAGGGRGAGGFGGGGFGGGGFGGGRRGGGTPLSPEALQHQAEIYAKLFEIFNKYSDTISRVTFWGISDTRSWRSGQSPLLFDGQLQPKPAYQAVIDVGLGKYVAPKQ